MGTTFCYYYALMILDRKKVYCAYSLKFSLKYFLFNSKSTLEYNIVHLKGQGEDADCAKSALYILLVRAMHGRPIILIYLGHFKIKRHILSQLCSSVYFNKHKNLLLQISFPEHIRTNFLDFYFSWKKKDQMMSFLSIFITQSFFNFLK